VVSPFHVGTFVFDAYTGAPCRAEKAHLTVALEFNPSPDTIEENIRCLLLVASAKAHDFGEERVAKVDWGHKAGTISRAQVVERNSDDI
jgi:syntaxin-binding protein 5